MAKTRRGALRSERFLAATFYIQFVKSAAVSPSAERLTGIIAQVFKKGDAGFLRSLNGSGLHPPFLLYETAQTNEQPSRALRAG